LLVVTDEGSMFGATAIAWTSVSALVTCTRVIASQVSFLTLFGAHCNTTLASTNLFPTCTGSV